MEQSGCPEHINSYGAQNSMLFVLCVSFMEEGKCGHSIVLDLDHEHASLSMLFVFVLHEDSCEYDSYWCFVL
jgi:hypothetical protein